MTAGRYFKLLCRILFLLLPVTLTVMRVWYMSPPADGGPPGPGDGFVYLGDAVFSVLLLPFEFAFWRVGFHAARFRKIILAAGLLFTGWPVLLVAIGYFSLSLSQI